MQKSTVEKLENTDYGPYTLRKRFRHEEEFGYVPRAKSWRKHILNLDEETFLERTASSWCLIILFYVFFYTFVLLFFYLNYHVFNKSIDPKVPKVHMLQPGFSFQPVTDPDSIRLIEYSPIVVDDIVPYVNAITDFLGKFSTDHDDMYGPCNLVEDYGYIGRNPCIFLKVNAIIGFIVEPYVDAGDLPNNAPKELRTYMKSLPLGERKDRLWLSCQGKTDLQFEYYPSRSIPIKSVHRPAMKKSSNVTDKVKSFYTHDDLQRVVAVRILNVPYDKKQHIKCFLWAKNIEIDEFAEVGKGMVRFQLLVLKGVLKVTE